MKYRWNDELLDLVHKPIFIEDDVWIAGKVVITAGERVGTGSVIAAGAVVTRDVPPWSIVAGIPAKVIRNRNRKLRTKLCHDKIVYEK
ncbi:MAG: hypothetical protein WD708_05820 [Kiritimatiellia bacterium]